MCKGLRNERPKQMELNAKGSFACRITRLFQYLTEDAEYKEFIISKQIFRSGTSIGANMKAAIERVQCPNSFEHCRA